MNKYQETLNNVRNSFLGSLGDYRREFGEYSEMLADGNRAKEGLKGMQTRAHKIRGIAATLGYEELGEAAQGLEEVVIRMQAERVERIEETARQFVACFRRMESALSRQIEAVSAS